MIILSTNRYSWLDRLLDSAIWSVAIYTTILLIQVFFDPSLATLPWRSRWKNLFSQHKVSITLITRTFELDGFSLDVPGGPIISTSETQNSPTGTCTVHTHVVDDASNAVQVTVSVVNYDAVLNELQRQIVFETITAHYRDNLGNSGRYLSRRSLVIANGLQGDELVVTYKINGHRIYGVVWSFLNVDRLFILRVVAPDRKLCCRVLESIRLAGKQQPPSLSVIYPAHSPDEKQDTHYTVQREAG